FVHQRHLWGPGQHSRDIQIGQGDPTVDNRSPGQHLEAGDLFGGVATAVVLDQADDHVGATGRPPATLAQHGDGLAHSGRRSQVDPQPSPSHHPSRCKARLSCTTLTRSSPMNPRIRPLVWASTRSRTRATARPLAAATRLTCSWAYAGLMSGSRPEADAVTASAGTEDGGTPSSAAIAARRSVTSSRNSGESAARFDPPEDIASSPSPAADGRPWNHVGP